MDSLAIGYMQCLWILVQRKKEHQHMWLQNLHFFLHFIEFLLSDRLTETNSCCVILECRFSILEVKWLIPYFQSVVLVRIHVDSIHVPNGCHIFIYVAKTECNIFGAPLGTLAAHVLALHWQILLGSHNSMHNECNVILLNKVSSTSIKDIILLPHCWQCLILSVLHKMLQSVVSRYTSVTDIGTD